MGFLDRLTGYDEWRDPPRWVKSLIHDLRVVRLQCETILEQNERIRARLEERSPEVRRVINEIYERATATRLAEEAALPKK